jgi:hypothetical protein
MKKYAVVCAAVGLALTMIGVAPAAAQETGTVGLVMTSGSTVGLTISASDNVAIRPSVSFIRSSADTGGLADGERTTTGWAPGVSVLFYVKSWDATRLYLSPQWTYSRATSSDDGANESKSTGHVLAAMVGAQHNLGSRFAVFGETGLARSTAESTLDGFGLGNKTTTWSTRSIVGAILFF